MQIAVRASRRLLLLVSACTIVLLCGAERSAQSVTSGGYVNASSRAERPASQAGVASSTSYLERTITWPTDSYCGLRFNYFVDSEPNWDFLRVKVDGVQLASWSGTSKYGLYNLSVACGTHTVRFEYTKDGSLDYGLDTAWIDNIRAVTSSRTLDVWGFDRIGEGLEGWNAGGAGAGWSVSRPGARRLLRRPSSQAFAGYQPGATTSSLQRTLAFSGGANNVLSFDYLVDSESSYDFFRVFVDGVQQFSVSGYSSGTKRLAVSPGSHLVRFEYYKDTSVDTGRDTAMVDNVAVIADGRIVENHEFDSYPLGVLPPGWSAASGTTAWVLADAPSAIASVAVTTPAAAPTIDGIIGATEWTEHTLISFKDHGLTTDRSGRLLVRGDQTSSYLYVALRVPAATDTAGGEQGTITLYFDSDHDATRKTQGCGNYLVYPGLEDRKIVFQYLNSTITAVQNYKGACAIAGWNAATATEVWSATAAITEPSADPGWLHFEARVSLRPSDGSSSLPYAQGLLGFAASHESVAGTATQATFPISPARIVNEFDVATWATLSLGQELGTTRVLEPALAGGPAKPAGAQYGAIRE